jgi:hypothetical protein
MQVQCQKVGWKVQSFIRDIKMTNPGPHVTLAQVYDASSCRFWLEIDTQRLGPGLT